MCTPQCTDLIKHDVGTKQFLKTAFSSGGEKLPCWNRKESSLIPTLRLENLVDVNSFD